jgi:hypothetical protein
MRSKFEKFMYKAIDKMSFGANGTMSLLCMLPYGLFIYFGLHSDIFAVIYTIIAIFTAFIIVARFRD